MNSLTYSSTFCPPYKSVEWRRYSPGVLQKTKYQMIHDPAKGGTSIVEKPARSHVASNSGASSGTVGQMGQVGQVAPFTMLYLASLMAASFLGAYVVYLLARGFIALLIVLGNVNGGI